jgi:diguanylate cyclase (GGDEF)-like protein
MRLLERRSSPSKYNYENLDGNWLFRQVMYVIESRQNRRLALTDSKTGLYNQTWWDRYSERIYDDVVVNKRQLISVVVMDFDWMHELNEMIGHGGVDDILRNFGKLLSAEGGGFRTSSSDMLVARVGGDEFAAILTRTGAQDAVTAAERVNVGLRRLSVLEPTATIGIADNGGGLGSMDKMFRAADSVLMQAKREGKRGTVSIYK